ncbi:MAG: beta-lactamase domain protein [Gemmatimonadetes bacterium]|nr:beta-lactamase domain protein [Gemmatimonadota bacterium]
MDDERRGTVASEAAVHEEAPGVVRIDHGWLGTPGLIASYLLTGDEPALVEAGPASTADAVLAGIRAAGHDPADVRHVLLTHIHLDHAAGTGALLRHMPRARVVVHPAGAAHLADPARLVASATRIYGGRMHELWGDVLPVPAHRIDIAADGEEVRAGGRRIAALHTPGHAGHHLAFHDATAGLAFTGDVAGVRLPGCAYVRPPTPPPEFDPSLWRTSIGRLRALNADRLLLTHFGAFDDPARHLDELQRRLDEWMSWARGEAPVGDRAAFVAALRERGDAGIRAAGGGPAQLEGYEMAVPYGMMADGILRWLSRAGQG